MSRAWDEEAMKPLAGQLPPAWWRKWVLLGVFAGSVAVMPLVMWLRRRFGL